MLKFLKTTGLFIFFAFIFAYPAHAIRYNLVAPSGQLTRGQDVQFTIEIDTQGETITSTQVGLSYDTRYLEYLSTVPGNAMGTVTVSPYEAGKLLITGTNTAGFTGSSTYAFVTFKLIAQAPGSTELCALFEPKPTTPPVPTSPVVLPTRLPRSGNESPSILGGLFGVLFVLGTGAMLYLKKKTMFDLPKKKEAHPHSAKKHKI